MATCTITGTLKDSGGQLLSGQLFVQLDGAIVDVDTIPDTTYLPKLRQFPIAAGVLNIALAQSETERTTYWFRFFANDATNVETGLERTPSIDFHAFVPNQPSIEFSALVPTGVTKDTLDTAIARLARILTLNQDYVEALRGGPRWKNAYNPATFYQRDDAVSYAGGVWIYINANPAAGKTPSLANAAHWLAGLMPPVANNAIGQDTAYDATGWDGATWSPSANAVRDIVEQLARANNTALTGNPTAPTQPVGTNNTRLATTAFAIAEIVARFTSPNFLGVPTVSTPLLPDNSGAIANTNFVKSVFHRYSRIIDQKAAGSAGGTTPSTFFFRTLNLTTHNAGDIVALSNNVITIRPGTYRVRASAPCWGVGVNRLFFDGSNGVRVVGQNARADSAVNGASVAHLSGTFTVAANADFTLGHYVGTPQTSNTNACGFAVSDGNPEVYSIVELWRLD